MLKKILLLSLFTLLTQANETDASKFIAYDSSIQREQVLNNTQEIQKEENEKVEIYATSMDSKNNIVKANGDVTVIYKEYQLTSNRAIYNRATGELELFDNVRATQSGKYKLLGEYAKLNIINKERTFKPFYMLDSKTNMWMSGDRAFIKDKNFDIKSGMVSGCNPTNPMWKMEFSSSDYDGDEKWINMYNSVLYMYDIPVMYVPYYGRSLDNTRRTGFLTPGLGYSGSEGFFFEQPIYIAEQNWWDLELKPQIRTNRGYGGYATFRFVDSDVSKGEFTTGYFKEKNDYFVENELYKDKHYGYNFKYENSNFINQWLGVNLTGQSGIYIDAEHVSDIDYINLSSNNPLENTTSSQILSKANMFYNTDDNYFGSYFKYYQYIDDSENDPIQIIPKLHYHHYLDSYFGDHLYYNLDARSSNLRTNDSISVVQTDINLPVTLQTSIFDEYINLSYNANFYLQHSSFSGSDKRLDTNPEDGYLASVYNSIAISTQVTKAYDNVTHVVGFGSRYTFDGLESRDGFYESNEKFCAITANKNNPRCDYYNIAEIDEVLQLDVTQYLYDDMGNQIVYHRLAQNFIFGTDEPNTGEIESELELRIIENLYYYNDMFYNFNENRFSKIYNKISYNGTSIDLSLSHLYRDNFDINDPDRYTSYLTSTASYKYDSHYSFHTRYNYDIEKQLRKSSEIGLLYKKRCWEFSVRYVENNRPVIRNGNYDDNVYERYIYFGFALKPLMDSITSSSEFSFMIDDGGED